MKKFLLLISVLALSISVCAQDSGTKTIQNQTEYNVYVAAINTADPGQRAAAIDAFLTTYPTSIMKPDALALAIRAYQQANNMAKSADDAAKLIEIEANNVDALTVLVYWKRQLANAGQNSEQNFKDAGTLAVRGLSALSQATKAPGEDDAALAQRKKSVGAIFHGAIGHLALVNKDFATGQTELRTAVEINPDYVGDVYPLALAYLALPKDKRSDSASVNGIFFMERTAVLTASTVPDFSKQVDKAAWGFYKSYHGYANYGHVIEPGNICQYEIGPNVGTEKEKTFLTKNLKIGDACNDSADGWEDVKKVAAENKLPPAGFTIAKNPPPTNADLIKAMLKKTPAEKMDVGTWIFIFGTGAQEPNVKTIADEVWGKVVNKRIRFEGVVVATEPLKDKDGNVVDLEKIIKDQQAKAAAAAKAGKAYKPEPLPDTTPQKIVMGVTLGDDGVSINKTKEVEVSMLNPIKLPEAGAKFQMEATLRNRVENASDKVTPVMLVMNDGEPFGTSVPGPEKKPPAKKPAGAPAKKKKK